MKMDIDEPIHSGFLLMPPCGKILIKKTWQKKYCLLFKATKFGIERLEVYDSINTTKGTPSRIITLENVIKITSRSPTHFAVTTRNVPCIHEFGAIDIQAKNEWLSGLQSVAFPDDVSKMTSLEEDNDLYCSSGEDIFSVKIHASPASERCGLDNKTCTLVLTSTGIQLRSLDSKLLYTWPYCFIRRYGCKSGKFTFEAGRMCESGEGTFFLEHENRKEIFRCLDTKINSMKKMVKGGVSPAILECGDNQLHAAFNMEARSRSPLPPSPTTSTTIHDSSKFLDESKPVKPVKPPRKSLNKDSDKSDYEPIDKYDHIEYRSDAWRTLGLNDVKHTEKTNSDEEEEYLSWGALKKITVQPSITKAPKIITESCSSLEDNYDKLNFFGSSSKLNLKSGYKQVSPAPQLPILPCPPSFNDYDEVQPAMEGIRLADDSHLGYAVIRKDSTSKDESVNHHFHNNEPYAVISKPKRV